MKKKKSVFERLGRAEWLLDRSVEEKDVLFDEDEEKEYIMEEPTLMDEDEPEDGRMRKVYLPEEFQN